MMLRRLEYSPLLSQQFRITEVDERNSGMLEKVNDILGILSVESNFGSLPQLIAFATNPPKRKLYILERDNEKRLCICGTYPEMKDLTIARILFQKGSEIDPEDEMLQYALRNTFHPHYIAYNLLPENVISKIDTQSVITNTHLEYVYNLQRLINCAHPDFSIARNPAVSIPHRAKEYQIAQKRNASLAYIPLHQAWSLKDNKINWRQLIDAFFTKWETDTGFTTDNDKRLLDIFWGNSILNGGVLYDTTTKKVVALNCFSPHPSRTDMVISTVDKNARKYKHLGVFSHISQALHIGSIANNKYKLILAGGQGSTEGQTAFKESLMSGGEYREHFSFEAYTDEIKLGSLEFSQSYRAVREDLLRKLWL